MSADGPPGSEGSSGAEGGPDADPWIGETLEGRFQIEERLQPDTFSRVYRAENLRLGGGVALKLIPTTNADPQAVDRLEREARAVTLIGHDNIVKVLDFARLDTVAYLAMELLEGETLLQRIERDGPMKLDALCTILIQVALALKAAHAHDVIHRGVHAGNIFLCSERGRSDVPKVLDFGLAALWKPLGVPDRSALALSSTDLAGRSAYMAPELLKSPTQADHRVDLYSLGVTFYHALAGRPPFTTEELLGDPGRALTGQPAPLSDLVPGLPLAADVDELVDFALQRDRDRRIGSAEIFRRALVDLRRGMNAPTRRREERASARERRTLASWVANGSDFTIVELAGALDASAVMLNVSERIAHSRVTVRLAGIVHIDSEGYYKWSRWLSQLRARSTALTLHDCSPKLVQQANLDPGFFQGVPVVSVIAPFYCEHCAVQRLLAVTREEEKAPQRLSPICQECGLPMRLDEVRETYFRFWSPPDEAEPPSGGLDPGTS